jgi:hypothetical protein
MTNSTIFAGTLTALTNDSQMTTWAISFIRYKRIAPEACPVGTLIMNTERSAHRPGYNASRVRDNYPVAQVDIWATAASETFPRSQEDVDLIADRADAVLLGLTPVTGTFGWEKISESSQFEDNTSIIHAVRRYNFRYNVTDA